MDCLFCKIMNGEIESKTIYEDDKVKCIMDAFPNVDGHVLVIPKEHYENFLATPHDMMHKVMDVAQRIGQVAVKLLGARGVNILTNCYEAAGQTVPHFHVHVIPRYDGSEGFQLEMKTNAEGLNLPALAEEIKTSIE